MNTSNIARTCALAIGLATAAGGVLAQNFPAKSGRILVGFAPGGNTDLVARILAQKLGEAWGQTVVVDNRPGASGMIAGELAAKSAPDGYTLLVTPQTSIAVAPALFGKAPYDPAKDFTPITLAGSSPLLMVVHPSFPPKTFSEFVILAKKSPPNSLTFGSGGIGSSPHMAGELLSAALGVKMNHVPYKGENPALTDTIGGQIPIMFGNLPVAVPYVNAGKLRGLANTSSTRSPLAPGIPTVAESGIKGYSIATWTAVLGPAGMPPELATRIQRDIVRVVNQPETKERLVGMGVDIIGSTPEDFGAFLRAEIVRYAKVIKEAGIKAE
ncbi:MAG: Bug family tripartite tricarboxylate transporter substrate binding protein [Burkholderiales bacterium]